jgi:hypothetical protein
MSQPARRTTERRRVSCAAQLRAGDAQVKVWVTDVSPAGAGLAVGVALAVGARVVLEFPGLQGEPSISAVVRHSAPEARRAGVELAPAEWARIAEELVRRFAAPTPPAPGTGGPPATTV